MSFKLYILLVIIYFLNNKIECWYLPGAAPIQYLKGTPVELKVNKLTSTHTQLPYKYYSLPLGKSCKPEVIIEKVENLGELLRGDRIENSIYDVGNYLINVFIYLFRLKH